MINMNAEKQTKTERLRVIGLLLFSKMKNIDLEVRVPLAVLDDEIFLDNLLGVHSNSRTIAEDCSSSCTPNFKAINDLLIDLDSENNNKLPTSIQNSHDSSSFSPSDLSDHWSNAPGDCDSKNRIRNNASAAAANNSDDSSSSTSSLANDETLSGSLEDLVGHFEEKLANCLKNFTQTTENLAPVQIRSQEEIMSESQIWLTLTGNFGNILPIDWSKSYARKLQLPTIKVETNKEADSVYNSYCLELPDDEALSDAMDLHSMVSRHDDWEPPPQSAEEVIEEIDEIIMQQSMNSSGFNDSDCVMDMSLDSSACSALKSPSSYLNQYGFNANGHANGLASSGVANGQNGQAYYDLEDRLREARSTTSKIEILCNMSYKQLAALKLEFESLVDALNENLVQELANRDELECDKEAKNTFISLLLNIQSKRRQFQGAAKKQRNSSSNSHNSNGKNLQNSTHLPQVRKDITL
uniref:Fasciculation and elongation protein zeta-2 n=1 Tax=Romanomermis culicivorax TaxID=13658 RepID=A0A915L6X4_ROMCU